MIKGTKCLPESTWTCGLQSVSEIWSKTGICDVLRDTQGIEITRGGSCQSLNNSRPEIPDAVEHVKLGTSGGRVKKLETIKPLLQLELD